MNQLWTGADFTTIYKTAYICVWPKKRNHGRIHTQLVVGMLWFYARPTPKVIRRWDLGFKPHPKD